MEQISLYIEGQAGSDVMGADIRKMVNGKTQTIVEALKALCFEGYLKVKTGSRGSQSYTSIRPYRQISDPKLTNDSGSEEEEEEE
jgi:hypothetical protein